MKFLIFTFLFFFLIGSNAVRSAGLLLTQHSVIFKPTDKSQSLILMNQTNETEMYELFFVQKGMDEKGGLIDQENAIPVLKDLIRYSPRRVTLKPKEKQTVRLYARRKGKDGEYMSHLTLRMLPKQTKSELFSQENENTLNIGIQTLFSYSIPVVLYQGKNLSVTGKMSNLKIKNHALEMTLTRTGNISLPINVKIYLNNEKQILTKKFTLYYPIKEVQKTFNLPEDIDLKGKLTVKLYHKDILDAGQEKLIQTEEIIL